VGKKEYERKEVLIQNGSIKVFYLSSECSDH